MQKNDTYIKSKVIDHFHVSYTSRIGLPFISENMFSRQPNEALSPCMVHEVCTELAQEQI
jgi:hypothetical protein